MKTGTNDKINRIIFILLSLAFLAIGVYGLARGKALFGSSAANSGLFSFTITNFVSHNHNLFWPIVAVVSLLIAYLGYRLIKSQISSQMPLKLINLSSESTQRGNTYLRSTALSQILQEDINSYPYVKSSHIKVDSDDPLPLLMMKIDVTNEAKLQDLATRLDQGISSDIKKSLGTHSCKSCAWVRLVPS